MKLSTPQIQQVEGRTGATAVPDDHAVVGQLESRFGEHTFFVDDSGLQIWEHLSDSEAGSSKLVGFRLATWSDEKRTTLVPHEPAATDVIEEPH